MFADEPVITTPLQALDEIDDAKDALEGMATMALALAIADVADRNSLALMSNVLRYCACSLEAARNQLEQ